MPSRSARLTAWGCTGGELLIAYTARVRLPSELLLALLVSSFALAAEKPVATIRWMEGAPHCSFEQRGDGRSYYGFSSADYDVTVAIDRQELEKIPHRATPMLGVYVSFHYRGTGQLDVEQNHFALEFTRHFQVVKSSLDPDAMLERLQQNMNDLTDEIERHQLKHHPEQRAEREAELQARLKDYTEMMDFISTRALRPTTLDFVNSAVSGWVFFSVKDKWIGPWRKPEQFILRLPIEGELLELPFTLPPRQAKVELRRRPED